MEINYKKLLNKVRELTKSNVLWHHHYLPPECTLISTRKHVIVLEAEGKRWQSSFDIKPLDKLEEFENIFFKRGKLD